MTARQVRFGRYRLVERIGAGGMAEVHRAVVDGPGGFQRTVVIKRMLRQLCGDDAFVRMLLAEGRLTALLHHPGIVQVHEVGEVDGIYYLAMEHVDGVDLASLLRAAQARRPLPPAVAVAIAVELAGALAYAHARTDEAGRPCDIVHRDVSPANIMVTPLGAVKLLDFGIAKAADSLRDVETRTGTLKGKVAYMSPEQAEGEPVDRRSDVFALGVVLHEMLTLRRLFRADDDLATLKLVRECAVAPPGVDVELDAIVLRMLARARDDRFGSCDEVVAALTPVARRLGGDAAAVREYVAALGPIERRVPRSTARETATFDLSPRVAPPPRRSRAPWIAAALSVALVGALAIALATHRRHAPPPPPSASPSPPPATVAATPPVAPPPIAAAPTTTPPPRHAAVKHRGKHAPHAGGHDLFNPFPKP